MEYARLDSTGMMVSYVCLGCKGLGVLFCKETGI